MTTRLAARTDEFFVAQVTVVEVTSVLFRAARGGLLSVADARAGAADLSSRVGTDFRVVALDPPVLARALAVAEHHALRGYDCVQLATALMTHDDRVAAGLDPLVLISADGDLNAAAALERLAVEDPNAH